MSLTSRSVRDEVQNYLDYLLAAGIALLIEPVVVHNGGVSYPNRGTFDVHRSGLGWRSYEAWVSRREYSAILFDGSLLQISYGVEHGGISNHRLAYVPCPFRLDEELLRTEGIIDLLELANPRDDLLLRAPVRFDFDPKAARAGHPAVHLTFNSDDCRLACIAPVRLAQFSEMVFGSFYASLWRRDEYLRSLPRSSWGGYALTDDEAAGLHLAWR